MSAVDPEFEGRRRAIRALLGRPLLLRVDHPEAYEVVRQNFEQTDAWFAQTTGWHVEHDRAAGIVRLHKVASRVDGTRPADAQFTRRHYTLLCMLLAELDGAARQVNLRWLSDTLRDATTAEPDMPAFDASDHTERRAFVRVVRWLVATGVLRRRDGDETRFLQGSQGDALYDVNEQALWVLLSCPRSPSAVTHPEDLTEEFVGETDDARRAERARTLYRRLLDDPVVYFEDLDPGQHEWLTRSLGAVRSRLMDAGLILERRLEGVAAIDPEGELCDQPFPRAQSTAAHAALKLTEWLSDARSAPLTEVEHQIRQWQDGKVGERWRKQTPAEIAADALRLLAEFQLVHVHDDSVVARPASARFRAEVGPA